MSQNNVKIYRVIKNTYYSPYSDSNIDVLLTTLNPVKATNLRNDLAPNIETECGELQEKITLKVQTAEILVEWC